MSEILSRARRSAAIIADTAIEPWQRAWQGLEALSGLTLSDLPRATQRVLERELVTVNHITASYALETNDDYESIDDGDIAEILNHIETVTTALVDAEVKRVMSGLREAIHNLPTDEIEAVRQHPDLFVPLLIDELRQAVELARDGNEPDGEVYFYAAFLLTELEVDAAFPTLLDGFKLRRTSAFDVFSEMVHELLPPALALFSPNNTDLIDDLIMDTSLDMFVRWSAASAYVHLVRDGVIAKETAVASWHQHLKECMAREDFDMVAPLICELCDFAAEEAAETIKEAYEQDLVDTTIIDLACAESLIAEGERTVESTLGRCRPTGMPDTIAELSRWASFSEPPPPREPPPEFVPPMPAPKFMSRDVAPPEPVATIRKERTVGRNDPCPCGSGKKYKKCCR